MADNKDTENETKKPSYTPVRKPGYTPVKTVPVINTAEKDE